MADNQQQPQNKNKGVGQADNLQNLKTTEEIIEDKILVTDQSAPEDLKVPLEQIANAPPQENKAVDLKDPKIQQEIKDGIRDNLGNINETRGIVGLVSNPKLLAKMKAEQQATGKIANPQTPEELKTMLDAEKKEKEYFAKRGVEMAKKIRLEMQGFKYKNPGGEFANDPNLVDTPEPTSAVTTPETVAPEKQGLGSDVELVDPENKTQVKGNGANVPETVS